MAVCGEELDPLTVIETRTRLEAEDLHEAGVLAAFGE